MLDRRALRSWRPFPRRPRGGSAARPRRACCASATRRTASWSSPSSRGPSRRRAGAPRPPGALGRVLVRTAAARGPVARRDRFRPDRRCRRRSSPRPRAAASSTPRRRRPAVRAGILLPKGSSIRTLADLKGKRVAFAKASSAHNLTMAALEKAGLTYADIEPVTLAPADAAAAFARGSIDAWTIWDPYFAIAESRRRGARPGAAPTDIAKQNNYFLGEPRTCAGPRCRPRRGGRRARRGRALVHAATAARWRRCCRRAPACRWPRPGAPSTGPLRRSDR